MYIQKEIYMLKYPYKKELNINILEAPDFILSVCSLSKNMTRKDSLLKIQALENNNGIKPNEFKVIPIENPQANIDLQLYI